MITLLFLNDKSYESLKHTTDSYGMGIMLHHLHGMPMAEVELPTDDNWEERFLDMMSKNVNGTELTIWSFINDQLLRVY